MKLFTLLSRKQRALVIFAPLLWLFPMFADAATAEAEASSVLKGGKPSVASKTTFGTNMGAAVIKWTAGPLKADSRSMPAEVYGPYDKFPLVGGVRTGGVVGFEPPSDLLGGQLPPPPNAAYIPGGIALNGDLGSQARATFSGNGEVKHFLVANPSGGPMLPRTSYAFDMKVIADGTLGANAALNPSWHSKSKASDPIGITAANVAELGVGPQDLYWDVLYTVGFGGSVDSAEGLAQVAAGYADSAGNVQSLVMTLTAKEATLTFDGIVPTLYLLDADDAWIDTLPAPSNVSEVVAALQMDRRVKLGVMLEGIPVPRDALYGTGDEVAQISIDLQAIDGAAAVPEPQALIMLVAGLPLLSFARRRRTFRLVHCTVPAHKKFT